MARSPTTTCAALGALLFGAMAQAAPADGPQAGSSGPNMPPARDIVPSEIRPEDPAAAGRARGPAETGAISRWRDIKRPPARPPSP